MLVSDGIDSQALKAARFLVHALSITRCLKFSDTFVLFDGKVRGVGLAMDSRKGAKAGSKGKPRDLIDIIFSWSLQEIFNINLYGDKVETIPESFQSVEQYLASYTFPLLEETRASLCSSMQDVSKLPFAKVTGFVKGKKNAYHVEVDSWRNRSSDRGKEPYKTLPGDVLMLTNAKPDTIPSLERFAGRWAFASVAEIAGDADGNAQTSTKFRVEAFLDNEAEKDCNLCITQSHDSGHESLDKNMFDSLNESQTKAVLSCLDTIKCEHRSAVEMIWGPPGTGKTKTVAALLFTLLKRKHRTLVCAPTNVAIKELAPSCFAAGETVGFRKLSWGTLAL
ncbi:hypothetical protein NL676_027007 [Syzygium grande]|nr:hypothetical protein NL676_027007 [Syzygium grande]